MLVLLGTKNNPGEREESGNYLSPLLLCALCVLCGEPNAASTTEVTEKHRGGEDSPDPDPNPNPNRNRLLVN